MNNNTVITNINPLVYVDESSRYKNSDVIYYNTVKSTYITFEIYKKTETPVASSDTFTVLDHQFTYRPDLLAHKVYGDPRLWWKIMEANNIKDILDFKAGINIRIPGTTS